MEFITVPAIVGIVFFGVYKLFELFVKKRERLLLIDKLVNNPNLTNLEGKQTFSFELQSGNRYGALKAACLLIGVGLGILIGFFINASINVGTLSTGDHYSREIMGMIYGASIFIFGGIGLLTAFFLELKFSKEKEEKEKI